MVIEPLAFLGVCLLVICTPGPDTALTIRNSIISGRRGGLAHPLLASFVPFALLGLLFCLMTFGWLSIYTLAIHRLGSFLQRSRVRRALEAVTGTVLVGLGARLAVDTRG
jgi:threonine/homoserine/homoserine lactone efflux protein